MMMFRPERVSLLAASTDVSDSRARSVVPASRRRWGRLGRTLVAATALLGLVGCTSSNPTTSPGIQGAGGQQTVALAIALGSTASSQSPTPTSGPTTGGTPQTIVQLAPVNQSGLNGSATLSDIGGGQTRVAVLLAGMGSITIHPVGIYEGSCPGVGATAAIGLRHLSAGMGATDVSRPLSDLQGGRMAIAVQKIPDDSTVVACGNITR